MESKWNETFGSVIFRKNMIRETWSSRQKILEEATRQGGTPTPSGRALPSHGPLEAPLTDFFRLYIPTYPQTIRQGAKTLFPPPQPSVLVRSHLGIVSGAPPEGESIMEGFYINSIASPMMCEQFTTNLRGPQLLARWLLISLWISIQSSPRFSWRSIRCNLLLRCVC